MKSWPRSTISPRWKISKTHNIKPRSRRKADRGDTYFVRTRPYPYQDARLLDPADDGRGVRRRREHAELHRPVRTDSDPVVAIPRIVGEPTTASEMIEVFRRLIDGRHGIPRHRPIEPTPFFVLLAAEIEQVLQMECEMTMRVNRLFHGAHPEVQAHAPYATRRLKDVRRESGRRSVRTARSARTHRTACLSGRPAKPATRDRAAPQPRPLGPGSRRAPPRSAASRSTETSGAPPAAGSLIGPRGILDEIQERIELGQPDDLPGRRERTRA